MPVHKITIIIIILVSNGTERYRVLLIGGQFFRAVTEISSCWEYAIVWVVMVPVHENNGHMVQKHFAEWQTTQRGKKN